MKAILEFDLPTDADEHRWALQGGQYRDVLAHMLEWFRARLKYDDLTVPERKIVERARHELVEDAHDRGLHDLLD